MPQGLPQGYLDQVVRAREVLQKTLEILLEYWGSPEDINVINCVGVLAEFNRKYGAPAEADTGMELARKALKEFILTPMDKENAESSTSKA